MNLGLGLALAAPVGAVAASGPNPNLLRWTEELENAAWVKEGVVVVPNTDLGALGGLTGDSLIFTPGSDLYQLSQTVAATGANVGIGATLTGELQRFSVTGTFNGLPYTYSHYLKCSAEGITVVLNILRSGGFLRCQITDIDEAGPTIVADGAKLEQAAIASAYDHRTT